MKKNKANIILIAAVAGVWTLLAVRFFNPGSAEPKYIIQQNNVKELQAPTFILDTFSLSNIKRDPFLDKYNKPITITNNHTTTIKTKKKEEQKIVEKKELPNVKYFGMIKNNTKEKEMVLISIDGKQRRMNQGEKYENIKLERVYKDSCLLSIGKDKIIVKK